MYAYADPVHDIQALEKKIGEITTAESALSQAFESFAKEVEQQQKMCEAILTDQLSQIERNNLLIFSKSAKLVLRLSNLI